MGAALQQYYDQAKDIGGLKATMRLAVITGVSSVKAGEQPDSPELKQKFEQALAQLKKEQ